MQNHRCRKVKNISGGATFRILVGGQGGPNIQTFSWLEIH